MSETLPNENRVSLWRDRRMWLVAGVALAVRVGLLVAALGTGATLEYGGLAEAYTIPARNFLNVGIFSDAQGPPYTLDTYRTPGYPLVLAEIWKTAGDGNDLAVALVQIALSVLAVILIYAAMRQLAGRRAALVAGLLLALSGLSAALPCYVISDSLYQFSVALWLFLLVRYVGERSWGNLLALSAVAGLGLYVRPVGLLFPAVTAVAALANRGFYFLSGEPEKAENCGGRLGRRLGQAVVALVIPALVVFPWMMRNHQGADTWEMTTVASENLMRYRAARVMSLVEGIEFYTEARGKLAAMAAARTPTGATRGERVRIGRAVALEYMWAHPRETVRAFANGAVVLLLLPDRWTGPQLMGSDEKLEHVLNGPGGWWQKAKTVLGQYHNTTIVYMIYETAWLALVWLMALAGWLRLRRWGRVAASNALGLVLLCLMAATICPEAEPRLRAPLLIPLVMLAGAMWLRSTGRAVVREAGEPK